MKIVAGNFKCNLTKNTTKAYLQNLESELKNTYFKENAGENVKESVYVFPPFTAIDKYNHTFITLGVQNAYPSVNGAFTGEIGLEQLDEFDIKTILIGHSERRDILGENQDFIINKFNFFKQHGFKIFYCIGENQEIRNHGEKQLTDYLKSQLNGIDTKYHNLIIAYEPIWAIGTGVVATMEQIAHTHDILKSLTQNAKILYGGSVNEQNAKDILKIQSVDGVLVGGASLDWKRFNEIIKCADALCVKG